MMTDEQLTRAGLVHDLRRMVDPEWTQSQYQDMPLPTPDHFWLHGTDLPLHGGMEFYEKLLADEKWIEFVPKIRYQKRGDWMDSFPPFCYRLTTKGRHVLDNPHEYVYGVGETS